MAEPPTVGMHAEPSPGATLDAPGAEADAPGATLDAPGATADASGTRMDSPEVSKPDIHDIGWNKPDAWDVGLTTRKPRTRVKGASVTSPCSPGYTVTQALHDKYGDDEPLDFEIHVSSKSAPGKTESGVLMVPRVLGLNYVNISSMGDLGELATVCSCVTDLDLSHNDISHWHQVVSLLKTLPKLHFLNLSHNPLHSSEPVSPAEWSSLPKNLSLSRIALNSTNISWSCLWQLMEHLPCLEELHFCLNDVDHVDPPPSGAQFPKIKHIYLNRNKLVDIQDLVTVGRVFPELRSLITMNNLISRICIDESVCRETFSHLQTMNIINCPIHSWCDLSGVRNFPKLTDIKLQGLPLTKEYEKALCRQLVLAYLPNISSVNGTPTTVEERDAAERAFLRHYKYEDNKPDRYQELFELHGNVDDLADVNLAPNKFVSVMVKFNDKTTLHQFPLDWTAKKLKAELAKTLVHKPARTFQLYHEEQDLLCGQSMLKYPDRTLLRYRFGDGDTVHIHVIGTELTINTPVRIHWPGAPEYNI